jgi:peptidoglycan/xylan/chitin deacetylase (PgdA/CDA1 family)
MLSWDNLREMVAAGMSIQSHTMTHPFLKQQSDDEITSELRDSKSTIEKELGTPVEFISLPNGSYGPTFKTIAKKTGYAGACCSVIGFNTQSTDQYFLRRIHVSGKYRIEDYKKIVMAKGYFVEFLAGKKNIKILIRTLMGENLYFWVYRLIFGIHKM